MLDAVVCMLSVVCFFFPGVLTGESVAVSMEGMGMLLRFLGVFVRFRFLFFWLVGLCVWMGKGVFLPLQALVGNLRAQTWECY